MIKVNGQEVAITKFPNGESNVDGNRLASIVFPVQYLHYKENESENISLINTVTSNTVEMFYETDADLIHLMFVKKYIDENCGDVITYLHIPYMPYSRMDRVEGYSVFTLKYICEMINSLKFTKVLIGEAHSDVCKALLNNCIAMEYSYPLALEAMRDIDFNNDIDCIYYPDATAHRRYSKKFGNVKSLVGLKKRNFETGELDSLEIVGDIPENNSKRKVVMIDDLSSFGGTFQWGAEKLAELGFEEIYLVVGHCEDSIFRGKIFENSLIKTVYTTNSIPRESVQIEEQLAKAGRMKVYIYNTL